MQVCHQSTVLHVMTDEERLKLQNHLKKMYLDLEKVCDKHNLKMMVGYGSALGALRHHGFIPWDDDMDILMPREDYDQLINRFGGELPKQYKIFAPNSNNGPIYRFAKVVDTSTRFISPGGNDDEKHGVFLDIFPLEGTSKFVFHRRIKWILSCSLMFISSSVSQYRSRSDLYRKIMCSTIEGKVVYSIRLVIGMIFSFYDEKKWFNLFDRFVKCSNVKAGYSVPSGGGEYRYFEPIDPGVYLPSPKMPFDDIEVYVPRMTERHCEMEYGDWHYIPKPEERWEHFVVKIKL